MPERHPRTDDDLRVPRELIAGTAARLVTYGDTAHTFALLIGGLFVSTTFLHVLVGLLSLYRVDVLTRVFSSLFGGSLILYGSFTAYYGLVFVFWIYRSLKKTSKARGDDVSHFDRHSLFDDSNPSYVSIDRATANFLFQATVGATMYVLYTLLYRYLRMNRSVEELIFAADTLPAGSDAEPILDFVDALLPADVNILVRLLTNQVVVTTLLLFPLLLFGVLFLNGFAGYVRRCVNLHHDKNQEVLEIAVKQMDAYFVIAREMTEQALFGELSGEFRYFLVYSGLSVVLGGISLLYLYFLGRLLLNSI